MPAKIVSLKMPNLPSVEVADKIELADRVSQLRSAGTEFDLKLRELEGLFKSAVNDLRRSYAAKVDAINGGGE